MPENIAGFIFLNFTTTTTTTTIRFYCTNLSRFIVKVDEVITENKLNLSKIRRFKLVKVLAFMDYLNHYKSFC